MCYNLKTNEFWEKYSIVVQSANDRIFFYYEFTSVLNTPNVERRMVMEEVLRFWFEELTPEDWFRKSAELDECIRQRFGSLYQSAVQGELAHWRQTARGRLAEIIVLDQFSRNLFREDARAFAADGMALVLAQEALSVTHELTSEERGFLYMPFMHSESLVIHDQAVSLFAEPGLEKRAQYEEAHRNIIERFGRYPHRNALLGRVSTPEELEFLKEHAGF